MPKKPLVGHHLMRVRIRETIFRKLQALAEEESERLGQHVTVSDLVRSASYNLLLIYESLRCLEDMPPDSFDDEITITTQPML